MNIQLEVEGVTGYLVLCIHMNFTHNSYLRV